MRLFVRLVAVLGLIVAAVLAAAVAILMSTDYNEIRAVLENKVQDATGRQLTIEGDLQFAWSLTPALAVDRVTFANAAWGSRPDMASVERLEAEVELLPLLGGDVRISRFVLSGLDLLLETDGAGRSNWHFDEAGLPDGDRSKPERGAARRGDIHLPVVADVRVRDVLVSLRDGGDGTVTRLNLEALDLGADDTASPLRVNLRGAYDGAPFSAVGELGSLDQLRDGETLPVSLRAQALGASLSVDGRVADLRRGEGLDLRADLQAGELALVIEALKSVPSIHERLPMLSDLTLPPLGPLRLGAQMRGSPASLSLSAFEFSVGRPGRTRLSVGGAVGNAVAMSGLDLTVSAESDDVSGLASAFGADLPALPAVRVAGQVTGGGDAFAAEGLDVRLGDSDLTGRVHVRLDGARPLIDARLMSRRLDLSPFLDVDDPDKASSGPERLFPDDPVPFDALAAIDADLSLRVEDLVVGALPFQGVTIEAQLRDGRLTVKPVQAGAFDGTVQGDAVVTRGTPPTVSVSLRASGVDAAQLMTAVAGDVVSTGLLDASLDARGRGASFHAIMSDLDGEARLVVGPGRIENALLEVLSTDVTGVVPFFGNEDSNALRCAVLDVKAVSGQANVRTLLAESEGMAVVGTGGADLGAETINVLLDPRAKSASLLKVASVPIRVRGSLADPTIRPDAGAAIVGAAGGAASAVTGLVESGAKAVGGLLGRRTATVDERDYCAAALGTTPAAAEKRAPSPSSAGQSSGVGGAIEDLGRGIERGLKGLFGN